MLERPTESEVGSLLLQVISPSYRASACQVDAGLHADVAHPMLFRWVTLVFVLPFQNRPAPWA